MSTDAALAGEAPAPENALARLGRALGGIEPGRAAPVERWNPPDCGAIDMRIDRSGTWHYAGSPIARPALVRLFASVLRRDGEEYCLVTPVERVTITVEDLPFRAVEMAIEGGGPSRTLAFRTDRDDLVLVGPDHPLRFDLDPDGGVRPAVRVRGGLWARLTRALALDLLDLVEEREVEGRLVFGIGVAGTFLPVPTAPEPA